MSAADPASLCGIDIAGLKATLPERYQSTWLVFRGSELMLVARKRGEELEFRCKPSDPVVESCLDIFKVLASRSFNPLSSIKVKLVNGTAPEESPFAQRLLEYGFRKHYQGFSL